MSFVVETRKTEIDNFEEKCSAAKNAARVSNVVEFFYGRRKLSTLRLNFF